LEGRRPYALNVEIDLTNGCNHRCSFSSRLI
jgi:2-iminoacetate synthase ThiH